eukprot:2504265-Rhodomonas_salina.1
MQTQCAVCLSIRGRVRQSGRSGRDRWSKQKVTRSKAGEGQTVKADGQTRVKKDLLVGLFGLALALELCLPRLVPRLLVPLRPRPAHAPKGQWSNVNGQKGQWSKGPMVKRANAVSYTHLRAHETEADL